MSLPLIGITCGKKKTEGGKRVLGVPAIPEPYMLAVLKAGGLPVIIPPDTSPAELEGLRPRLDGLLLTGGADVDPQHYCVTQGARSYEKAYGIDSQRDEVELTLARLAARSAWPFLGICRGIQVINVALGGTLYVDVMDQLPQAIKHDYNSKTERDVEAHAVQLKTGSALARIMGGNQVAVNSLHHQGLEKIAAGLRPTALAPDQLVEGVELEGHPFGLGVQWHPEAMPDSAPMQAIFRAFIEATKTR